MRIQRWLERKGIVVTPENEEEVEDLLAEGEWQREPEVLKHPLDRAQALIYDAFELPATMESERIRLAKEALKISDNCADAHTLLAEHEAISDEAALRHSVEAVKAAERAFADIDVAAHPRDSWFLFKLRPLLRALAGRASNEAIAGHTNRRPRPSGASSRSIISMSWSVASITSRCCRARPGSGDHRPPRDADRLDRAPTRALHPVHRRAGALPAGGRRRDRPGGAAPGAGGQPLIARYMLGAERVQYDNLLLAAPDEPKAAAADYYTTGSSPGWPPRTRSSAPRQRRRECRVNPGATVAATCAMRQHEQRNPRRGVVDGRIGASPCRPTPAHICAGPAASGGGNRRRRERMVGASQPPPGALAAGQLPQSITSDAVAGLAQSAFSTSTVTVCWPSPSSSTSPSTRTLQLTVR